MGAKEHRGKLVHGVGVNDSKGSASTNKGLNILKSYTVWCNMLRRCYKPQKQEELNYVGCSVSGDWLQYSNFKQFYDANYFEGSQLDKDLIKHNNKVYSHDTCTFVSREVNLFFKANPPVKGRLSGVNPTAKGKYYGTLPRVKGKGRRSHSVPTQEFAHELYCKGKQQKALELINTLSPNQQHRDKVIHSLLNYVDTRFGPEGSRFYNYGT